MTTLLPSNPSLTQLRMQAKDVLKAHKSGDTSICSTLRRHSKFASLSDSEMLDIDVSLQDAQHALALGYGFSNWRALRNFVEPSAGVERYQEIRRDADELSHSFRRSDAGAIDRVSKAQAKAPELFENIGPLALRTIATVCFERGLEIK